MAALFVVQAVVLALLGVLVAGLLRSHAEILRALHDLGAGVEDHRPGATPVSIGNRPDAPAGAADLTGVSPDGDAVAVAVAGARHDTLLAFLTTGCSTCGAFWDAFATGGHDPVPGGARLVVVTRGPGEESPAAVLDRRPAQVPVVMSSAAWQDYDVPVAPFFVYVDGPSGRIAGQGAASSWSQVSSLLGQALADRAAPEPDGVRSGVDRSGGVRSGAAPSGGVRSGGLGGPGREARADAELTAAGILPGDPRLYPTRIEDGGR